ncbi:MAG: DUF2974 domain-containing protein [Oscillospiraceae bacterium]|nr:DUF2974 domain-containing protein [Oscillospiraceae bacterium]
MANILDYLDWRGDLSLTAAPFNEVDNLILAELSFIDYSGIVPEMTGRGAVTIAEAAERYFAREGTEQIDMGVLVPDAIVQLLQKAAKSSRFSDMRLVSYVSVTDLARQMQFAALTVELAPKLLYVAFRGTDDTLVGWKEDFNMSFLSPVPGQTEAVRYLERVARHFPAAQLMVGGHSKGGNFAVYAAIHAKESVQKRILAVYNNDGPGFEGKVLGTPEHQRISDRIRTIVPEDDVVGMMMGHEERYSVVRSDQMGFLQHDGFSWQVLGDSFVHLSEIGFGGRLVDQTLKSFAAKLTKEEREHFVDALYVILTAGDAKTLTDLQKGSWKMAGTLLKTGYELDEESRRMVSYTLRLLFREGVKSLRHELKIEEKWERLLEERRQKLIHPFKDK